MYHNSGDPYAGQYPMPPPAPEQYQAPAATSTPPASSSNYYPPSSTYYTPQHVTEPDYFQRQPEPYPSYHRDSYEPQHHRASYEPQHHQASYEPQHQTSYDPQIYHPHPNTSYYIEELDESSATPETPIVEKHNANSSSPAAAASNESPKKKGGGWHPFKRHNKQEPDVEEQLQPKPAPPVVGPRPAPEDEKPTYKPSAGPEPRRGASCCCYNPALTCCSVFWMLVSIAFLAGGIALMVASKIVTDKCNNECGGGNDTSDGGISLPDNCTILCSNVLHDGLLYGGAVVTGLAGIAVIWKLFMWCCAGYSRR